MKRKVVFVELGIYERLFPLVSGYLQAYACRDPFIAQEYQWEQYTATVRTPFVDIVSSLVKSGADIYAFSCYVWNMSLVRRAVDALRTALPKAYIILGGPQVMRQGALYLTPDADRVVICNGEGERTFASFVATLAEESPDLSRVGGLSFCREGQITTTDRYDRLTTLDDIPSPFLTGLFTPRYTMAIYETNRGCPFSCGFCYWGAATNDKVIRFSDARVKEELTWLSKHDCLFLYLADANWGILPRDVDITEHIAACVQKYRLPSGVYFSAAKNKPERVLEITQIFARAGIIASQPVSLQTLNPDTLALVDRANIKLSAYATLQNELRRQNISSFTELIWPLPGETLETLQEGINKLCEGNGATIVVYPHLLLNNTALYHKRDELQLTTRLIDDSIGEVRVVVGTAQVAPDQFETGIRFFYGVHLLHNLRALHAVTKYLVKSRQVTYADLFMSFADFCFVRSESAISRFCEESIATSSYYDVFNMGKMVHYALHADRTSFEELLYGFVTSQRWWADANARLLYEVDALSLPYVYSNTPMRAPTFALTHLKIVAIDGRTFCVDAGHWEQRLRDLDVPVPEGQSPSLFMLDHKRLQYPFMSAQSFEHNAGYCHGMILKFESIRPTLSRRGSSRTHFLIEKEGGARQQPLHRLADEGAPAQGQS